MLDSTFARLRAAGVLLGSGGGSHVTLAHTGTDLPQVVRFQSAEKSNLAEMNDLAIPLCSKLQLLKRCPILCAQTEDVDAEPETGPVSKMSRCVRRVRLPGRTAWTPDTV
jgi:hypothetical protein